MRSMFGCSRSEKVLRNTKKHNVTHLEAFSVDDRWTRFIIFLFWDPHLLEGWKWGQDGTTNPDGIFSFWWSNDFDFHCWWCQGGDFLLHTVGNTWVHGGATREDSVGIQVLSDIDIALHDGVVSGFMNTSCFHTQEWWLEKGFWASESFVTNGNDLNISINIKFSPHYRVC